jgi:spore coat protein U-like protein
MKPKSIRLKPILWLAALAMLAFSAGAQARFTCNITAASTLTLTTAYGSALNITAGSITVSCTSNNVASRTATYQISAPYSANATGTQRRAAFGANFLNYNLGANLGCSTAWNNTTAQLPTPAYTTPAMTSASAADVHTFYFWFCVPAGLTVPAAGTYTDTTNLTVTGLASAGGFTGGTGALKVNITAPATCSLSTPPGNIVFNYTSFGAAANASTTFGATCTNLLPYTMALDATTGTLLGLTYTLALSAASATGSGVAQSYTINGTIAAGQSGTCAATTCTGSQTRTLTISY